MSDGVEASQYRFDAAMLLNDASKSASQHNVLFWKYGAQIGLEYVDFAFHGMHVQNKPQASKHHRAPIWAMDDGALHLLVARFLENRAGIEPLDASIPERITRAEEELKSRRPQLFERLDRLSHRYVELKRAGGNQKLIRKLEIQIQVLDMQLVILDKSPRPTASPKPTQPCRPGASLQ